MNKLLLYAIIGGGIYWYFLRKPAAAAAPVQQAQLTVEPNPQQMSPTVQGMGDYYNIDAFPMGTFA